MVALDAGVADTGKRMTNPGGVALACVFVDTDADADADRCYDQAVAPRPPMSEEQLKAFLEKVKGDTSLQEKLKGAGDEDAVVAIAKEAGFIITIDEIKQAQSGIKELSGSELDVVAGFWKAQAYATGGGFANWKGGC